MPDEKLVEESPPDSAGFPPPSLFTKIPIQDRSKYEKLTFNLEDVSSDEETGTIFRRSIAPLGATFSRVRKTNPRCPLRQCCKMATLRNLFGCGYFCRLAVLQNCLGGFGKSWLPLNKIQATTKHVPVG